jgi:hypothetical protein
MRSMQKSVCKKDRQSDKKLRWLPEFDRLLIAGIKHGPAMKREAINRILDLAPQWTRGDCWKRIRHLRTTHKLAALENRQPKTKKSSTTGSIGRSSGTPWTPADDDRLLNLAGYEPVPKIAQRLGRSVSAVRFRLGALGMSARVTDGWSPRALRKMLRMRTSRLRFLISNGLLRVRDARILAQSLSTYCDMNRPSLNSATLERIATAVMKIEDAFSWERVASLLDVPLSQVQSLISSGQLKVADAFVTDRSFEEFCKKHGDQINIALLDQATARWLVSEYGVSQSATRGCAPSRAQKHILTARACKCGRTIAGNAYFKHIRTCQGVVAAAAQYPTQAPGLSSGRQSSARPNPQFTGSSTYESAFRRQSSKAG